MRGLLSAWESGLQSSMKHIVATETNHLGIVAAGR